MSREYNLQEAKRWIRTAEDDLDTAVILNEKKKFAHSCFHAQQAGEKAIKALWYLADADPWGHSIKKLIEDLQSVNLTFYENVKPMIRSGMVLDRYYLPTRYPNGLPDITPDQAFNEEDAQICLEYARNIIEAVVNLMA